MSVSHSARRLSVVQGPAAARRAVHGRGGREAGAVGRGVRPPAEALPLRLQAAARDPHRPDHRRADLRAEDRLRAPRLPVRRARHGAAHAHRRDARAAAGPGGRAAPGAGGVLRRDPRRADDGGAAVRACTRSALGALAHGDRAVHGGHQPADRRPEPPRAAVRAARTRRDAAIRAEVHRGCTAARRRERCCEWFTTVLDDLLDRGWRACDGEPIGAQLATAMRCRACYSAKPYVVRPRPAARRAVHRPVEPGRQRRGVPLQRDVPGAGQGADDALQAAPRDRRAGDDGDDHRPDAGQAVGVLPRHVAGSSGTRPGTR